MRLRGLRRGAPTHSSTAKDVAPSVLGVGSAAPRGSTGEEVE